MSTPVATIGIPVFNGARFLPQCLESALSQSVTDIEILVSDNGSTDATPSICRHYAERDSRIVYMRSEENRGAAWNHNRLIDTSHAPLFKWLAADDYLASRFVEACAAALQRRPDAVVCFPGTMVVDEAGAPAPVTDEPLPLDSPDAAVRFTRLLDPWKACHCPFYGLFRASALHRNAPLGAYLGADRVFLAGLALQGPFVELPEPLFFRRKHSGNQNIAVSKQQAIYSPGVQDVLDLRETRLVYEQLGAIGASAASARMKARLTAAVFTRLASGRAMLLKEWRAAAGQAVRRMAGHPQQAVNKEICN